MIEEEEETEGTSASSNSVGEEDYFIKFNSLTGWQSVLLLQFQYQMAISIMGGLFVTYTICMTEAAFALGTLKSLIPRQTDKAIYNIIYVFDLFYLVDLISMVIYKKIHVSETHLRYQSRHYVILLLEFLSIIPIDPIYKVMVKNPDMRVYYCLRLRYALRLTRIYIFFKLSQKYIGEHIYLVHLLIYFSYLVIVIVTVGSVAYVYECYMPETNCTNDNYFERMTTILYHSGAIFSLVGASGFLPEFTILNNIFMSFLPYVANTFFLSYFACDIIQTLKMKFSHLNTYTWFFNKINLWKCHLQHDWRGYHRKYELLIKEHGTIIWVKTSGHLPDTYINRFLPPIMYKEIFLDLSWVALKHSHLFRNEDVFFLRSVSTLMKQNFFCPGEVIYKRNKYKGAMIYVISGIVEILSEEDGETPIMSLSTGSVLGESSIIMGYPSRGTTVSKNLCEVVILYRKDFIRIAKLYPDKYKRILNEIQDRYQEAKFYRKLSLYQFREQCIDEKIGILTMKWLKLTLITLLFNTRKLGDLYNRYYLERLERNVFCAKFLDFYVMAENLELTSDSVFIRNTFPFVFKKDSVLLKTWNTIILIFTIALAATYPYYFIFSSSISTEYIFFFTLVTIMWCVDLYIKSSTAIKTKYQNYEHVSDIIVHNLSSITYIVDIWAATTPEMLIYMVEGSLTPAVAKYACANRLLKLYKLEVFFLSLRGSSGLHVRIKYIKFIIYLLLSIYYCGTIFFLVANLNDETHEKFKYFLRPFHVKTVGEVILLCCFSVIEYYGDLTFINFPFLNDTTSFSILMVLQIIQYTFTLLFLASIISDEILNNQHLQKMDEFVHNIDVTMKSFNLNKRLQTRVWRYIRLQYQHTDVSFLIAQQSYKRLPQDLYVMTCGIEVGYLLKSQPLFFDLSEAILAQISTAATIHLFPSSEVIKNVGEVCTELHILIEGFCLMERADGLSKTVEPGECLFVLETNMNIPSLVKVTATTHCKIITVNYQNLKSILLNYPEEYIALQNAVVATSVTSIVQLNHGLNYVKRGEVLNRYVQKNIKAFGYKLVKRTKRYNQFHEGFPRWACPLKYLLLRLCFYSNGRYVFWFEVVRCIFAIAENILFPMSCLFSNRYGHFHTIMAVLDVTAAIDLYLRHHYSYFNSKGVEVTHPFKTTCHYWKHALTIDVLGCIPFEHLIYLVFGTYHMLTYLNRLFQLYRVHGLFKYIFRNNMKAKGFKIAIQIFLITIISINVLTGFTFSYFCDVIENKILCLSETWISRTTVASNIYKKYIMTLFFTVVGLMYSGFHQVNIVTMTEVYYLVASLIFGFIMFNLIIAKVVAASLTINRDLISYQEAMYNLVVFMNYRRIDRNLKTELINHFEYMWDKTKGKSIHTAFAPFKTSFKIEALYYIYGTTFKESSIFPAPNQSFFKSLLIDIKHEIYLKTGIIYSVNDISGDIFLLLRGRVEVAGADGNKLVTLHIGSIFGNLDNCPLGRRTLKMVALGHVEVLKFSSTIFYAHLSKFPALQRHFRRLTIFNVDFLEETRWKLKLTVAEPKLAARSTSRHLNILSAHSLDAKKAKVFSKNSKYMFVWESIALNIVCFFTYIFELYHMSTLEDTLMFTFMLYSTDVLFIIKIYLKFHTTYEDVFGRVIKKRGLIALRYMQKTREFYYDLFTIIPFELICLLFLNTTYHRTVWAVCRFNRLVRILMVLNYLKSMTQKLNINVFVMKSLFLLTCVIVIQLSLGSLISMTEGGYRLTAKERILGFMDCVQIVVNTSAKLSFRISSMNMTVTNAMLFVVVILLSKAVTVFFTAECCSILHIVTHTRNSFQQFIVFMRNYMYTENVSLPLAERVYNYMGQFWNYNKAIQFPKLLNEAPYYLKEAVLNSMFGCHLLKHPILQHCHKDLMRQMTANFKTLVFFPGDMIVYMGDIDNCMYFIHEGEVQVLSEDKMYSEIVEKVLISGDMFGLHQGLYDRCKHDYTYKVTKFTIVVYLNRESWIYLLDFFPASKYLIYKLANEEQHSVVSTQ